MTDPDRGAQEIDPLMADLALEVGRRGFDLIAHTTVAAYHEALGDRHGDPGLRLPDAPAGEPSRAVVLIGNSRAVWPAFMAALAAEPARRREPHPFDRWTSEVLGRSVAAVVGARCAFDLRYAFEADARAFSAQHLAEAAGLACRGPAGLSVHPTLGPWFSLRAAIVLALPGRRAAPPDALCERCRDKPCMPALARALGSERPADHTQVRERWRAFLAVRDACPVGRAMRFSDPQIRWHYAHDRSALQ